MHGFSSDSEDEQTAANANEPPTYVTRDPYEKLNLSQDVRPSFNDSIDFRN